MTTSTVTPCCLRAAPIVWVVAAVLLNPLYSAHFKATQTLFLSIVLCTTSFPIPPIAALCNPKYKFSQLPPVAALCNPKYKFSQLPPVAALCNPKYKFSQLPPIVPNVNLAFFSIGLPIPDIFKVTNQIRLSTLVVQSVNIFLLITVKSNFLIFAGEQ